MKTPFIIGPTGRQISLHDPDFTSLPKRELLVEIATGLSQTFRFSGHTRQFYTVAQHSVLLTILAPGFNPTGQLLHDASEAYLGDIPTPLKAALPDYVKLESLFQSRILAALDSKTSQGIKDPDHLALLCEMELLGFGWPAYGVTERPPKYLFDRAEKFLQRIWSREEAKNQWLELYYGVMADHHPLPATKCPTCGPRTHNPSLVVR